MKLNSIIILNSFLVAVSLFYTQAYLTCLPVIANNLLTSHSIVQLIFTANILFFGFSQIFYGSFSDYYGRKKCLLAGLWIGLVGNVLSLFSNSIGMFCIGQLIAGFGAGSCSVMPRAISKDILSDSSLVKAISYMSMASTVAAGLAPILGGIFQEWFGWRSVFLLLNGITIITLILVTLFMPETIHEIHRAPLRLRIVKSYRKILLNNHFLIFMMLNSCAYSSIVIYLILSPFLFQTTLGYSANQNSLIYLFCSGSYLSGNLLLGQLIEKLNFKSIISLGITIVIIGTIIVMIPIFLEKLSAIELVVCGVFIHFGSGLITPLTYKQILSIHEFSAGISSGAINATRVFVAFAFGLLATLFSWEGSTALALVLGMLSLTSVGIYFVLSDVNLKKMEQKLI